MAERCVKVGCPEVLRLALQDPCTGAPVPGTSNGVIIRCQRNTTLEKVVRDPEISEFVSDCGNVDRYVQDGYLQGFNLSFEVSSFSPETEALLNGEALIDSAGTNIGVFYESQGTSCSSTTPDPRFIAEAFFRVRQCDAGGSADYIRYVITGLRFNPSAIDKEGQINIMRFEGTSEPTLVNGLTSVNDGPFADLPAAVVTELGTHAGDFTPGFWFVDNTDPTAGAPLAANTCYTTEVPVAAP